MAGDWIKMRSNLWDDPRIAKLCDMTDQTEAAIVGGLYWLWSSADQHSEDGTMSGLTLRGIDRKTGIPGFGAALVSAGWLIEISDGVQIVRFEEHNGKSAKRRCSEAVRKMSARDADKSKTYRGQIEDESQQSCAPREREEKEVNLKTLEANASVTGKPDDLLIQPEKIREIPEIAENPAKAQCPADAIVALYHELMPDNPRVKVLDDKRRGSIRARWKQAASLTCQPFGYSSRESGLAAWRKFFEVCAESDFLTGKAPPLRDKPPFVADIDFLMSPSGFAKCLENKYHREREAA